MPPPVARPAAAAVLKRGPIHFDPAVFASHGPAPTIGNDPESSTKQSGEAESGLTNSE
jgi:hypothetical protein